MTQPTISQLWNYINQILELQPSPFNIKLLQQRQWYLQVVEILFPFLNQEWKIISNQIRSEEAAIDRILLVLVQEGALPEEYLTEIKGSNIVKGNQQTIVTFVQILNQFVQQALEEEGEEGQQGEQEEGEGDRQGQYHQNQQEREGHDQINFYQQYKAKTQEQPLIGKKSPMVTIKGDSQPDHQRNANSVLGIGNQFQDNQEQDQQQSDQRYQVNFNNNPKGFNHPPQLQNHSQQYQTYNTNKNKFLKMTNYKNQQQQQEQQQSQNYDQDYLQHKLKKCKSQQKFKNIPKKQKQNKNKSKQVKILISHPQISKNYYKAKNTQQKKLTKHLKNTINQSRKCINKQNFYVGSPAGKEQLDRKKREADYYTKISRKNQQKKNQIHNHDQNTKKLQKLLKWKQHNLKKQQQQTQQNLQMKLQLKKQNYIKKINKMIINLQRQKMIENRRQQRQRQKKQKIIANQRLLAIQQQYKNQINMINNQKVKNKGSIAHTDHKIIIQNLEKQLKKENQKHIHQLKTKLRREQAQIDDDLQILQKEIIKAYKRN